MKRMTPIPYADLDTLFLDVGNTLISMNFEWVADELARLGVHCDTQVLCRAEAAARPLVSKGLKGRSTEGHKAFIFYVKTVLSRLSNAEYLDLSELDEISHALAGALKSPNQSERLWSSVIPGVPAALTQFREWGLRLVVVSNSDGTIEEILTRQGLRHHFNGIYDSHQVGFEKPDPRIFLHVLKDLSLDPNRILHVGDLYDIDVKGARAAGLEAALVDPFGVWKDVDCERVRDLGELCHKMAMARNIN